MTWSKIRKKKRNPINHRRNESTPLDKPVTHITRPANGAFDGNCGEDETGDIWSNGWRFLIEDENSLKHPLPLTTSTLPSPPITVTTTKTVNKTRNFYIFYYATLLKTKASLHHQAIENLYNL